MLDKFRATSDMQSILQDICTNRVKPLVNVNNHNDDESDSMDEWVAYKENLFISSSTSVSQQHQHQQFNGKRRKRKPLLMMDLKENQFLVGYNRMENMIAITLVEQSRRSTDDRSNCLATCVQYVCTLILAI